MMLSRWVTGGVRTGKTRALVEFVSQWWSVHSAKTSPDQSVLLFSMNADNRQQTNQKILAATDGAIPLRTSTPLGFFEEEVMLFWPLIVANPSMGESFPASFPMRLRPEAEQHLAVQLWGTERLRWLNEIERYGPERWARNLLDVLQLAAFASVSLSAVPPRLQEHWSESLQVPPHLWSEIGQMLMEWRHWCLKRGFLTYGLVSELYWQCLLPSPQYRAQLKARFCLLVVDDSESYPAAAGQLFQILQQQGVPAFFTENADFSIRLGLGADPDYLRNLQLSLNSKTISLPLFAHSTPIDIERIETVTRSQLLRATAESAAKCIRSGEVKPEEIAIIGPGLDSLARYALIDIIEAQGIPVVSWKEQRPLYASALVRSLLSLLAFVYQDLGRQLSRDSVAEMIEVMANIDAVRAGLLADYCFRPDTHCPLLLPLEKFPRWDRVGNQAAQDYDRLRHWIKRAQQPSRSPPECLSQAIAFFWSERSFRYDESAALRELLETSQHFAKIGDRLQQTPSHSTLNAFISVIKQGTMTANPYPDQEINGVILATAYQYRIARLSHRYHFWLDASSLLWHRGSQIRLWSAIAFLSNPNPNPPEQDSTDLVHDLLHRADEKIFLCSSELSTTGEEQIHDLTELLPSEFSEYAANKRK